MRSLRQSATRRLPPALRVVTFVLMLWVIGLFPMFHTDADELAHLSRTTVSAPVIVAQSLTAPVEPCPVCAWLARTPYTPARVTPLLVVIPPAREQLTCTARAPPRQVCRRIRNRAPPFLV
ncbi:MAG TPA: hypothetical protein V6D47_04485 [Oscillatoriaceae cyanobacterium]